MSRLYPFLSLALALALAPLPAMARPPAADDAGGQAFTRALDRMKRVSDGLTEYKVRLHKREWVDGSMTPEEVIDVSYRRPWDVIMRWVAGKNSGRLLLYRGREWNDGRFVVDPGPLLPVVSLHPTSRLAMAGSRHSLYDLPITEVVDKFVRDARKVAEHPTWEAEVVDEGPSVAHGEAVNCYRMTVPKEEDPTFYAKQIRACLSDRTGLPTVFRAWDHEDGALRVVEEYDYAGFDLAPGLTEEHFDRGALGL